MLYTPESYLCTLPLSIIWENFNLGLRFDLLVNVNTILLKCFGADDRLQHRIMERKSRSLFKNCYLPQIRGWRFRCPAAHQYMYEVGAMTRTHPTPCWSPAQTPRQITYSNWKTAKHSKRLKPAGIQNSNELAELGSECNVIRVRVSSEELPRTHTRGWTNPPIGINATMCTLDTFSWICWLETCVFVFLCLQLSGSEGRHLVTSTLQVEKEQNTPRGWSRD